MGRVMPRTPPISGISYSTGVAMLVWGKDQRLLKVKDLMGSCGWFWVQMHCASMATCSSDVQGLSWHPWDFLNLHIMTGLCNYLTHYVLLSSLSQTQLPEIVRHHWTRTSPLLWAPVSEFICHILLASLVSILPLQDQPFHLSRSQHKSECFSIPSLLPHLRPGFQTYQNLSLLI